MPRRPEPPRLVRAYAPDPDRCTAALLRLLAWEPPPAPAGGAEDTGAVGAPSAPSARPMSAA